MITPRKIQSFVLPKARLLNIRCFHNSLLTSGKNTFRDTRVAGRQRFYKLVGVTQVSAPWEKSSAQEESIDSPVSAGIDGSASASGVRHLSKHIDISELEYMLTPRKPGSTSPTTNPSWHSVTLDGRIMKTPMGQVLAVPSQSLAHAIAAEWDAQEKYIQPANMPLMTLACTALDQVAHHPQTYREQSMNYLPTDTTCFWADPTEDRVLHRRQQKTWADLHSHVRKQFHHAPALALGASEGMIMARKRGDRKPSAGLPHPSTLMDMATQWTNSLDAWHLVAFHSMCSQAKSFLVAWAVLEGDSPFSEINKAIEASRVEEEFQISNWGLVEGGHDYDRLNCSIQLYSAAVFTKIILLDNNLS